MTNNTPTKEKCLALAFAYKSRGWSVIPVDKRKIPVIPWKQFQTRMATNEEIKSWWQQYPDAQVGIVTGWLSNLTVVDIEVDGDFNLIQDETYTVKTGGGGRHLYFEYDSSFQNMVRVLDNVDIRSEGGYVVAAGSETQKGAYEVLKDVETSVMSSSIQKTLLNDSVASEGGVESWDLPPNPGAEEKKKQNTKVALLLASFKGSGEGERNDQMARFIGKLLSDHTLVHPVKWDTEAWDVVQKANQKNSPPLPEKELRATFNSIRDREVERHPSGRFTGRSAEEEEDEDVLDEDIEILHLSEAARRQEVNTDEVYPTGLSVFDQHFLGGFSPGDLIVISGKPGHGKTSIMQSWTMAFARYSSLASLWFSYETLPKPLWEQFVSMGAEEDTPIFLPERNDSGNIQWVTDMILKGVEEQGVKVVVIDHLGYLDPPKRKYANSAEEITHTVRHLKKLAVKHGLVVLLPSPLRKTMSKEPGTDDILGSTGPGHEATAVFFIEREKDSGVFSSRAKLSLVKNRKTGVCGSEMLSFFNGRFYYEDESGGEEEESKRSEEKSLADESKQDVEERWKNF